MSDLSCDLFVIGAGSGGVRAARIAASYGARVFIAEADRVGGTCVIRGCVPKKLLVYASRFADMFDDAAGFGWEKSSPHFDWRALIANKDREIVRLEGLYKEGLAKAGVTLFPETVRFEDASTLHLSSGQRVKAQYILIATGGHPVRPDFPGAELAITSNDAFQLSALPERIVIIGAGYIAFEFASIFSGLGSEVTLISRGKQILRGFDDEIAGALMAAMKRRGIRFIHEALPQKISRQEKAFMLELTSGTSIAADQIMLATGRRPNTNNLNLEAARVLLTTRGAVAVNAYSQSSVPHIYAVGDVTDRLALTPVAIREGHAFADTVFGNRPWHVDHDLVPSAVFATPEMAGVGLSEAKARALYPAVDIYRTEFRPLKATLSGSQDRALMKLVVNSKSGVVLGAHMLGEDAAEMAQLLAIPLRMKATKADFDATMALHPTAAEEWVTLRDRSGHHEQNRENG